VTGKNLILANGFSLFFVCERAECFLSFSSSFSSEGSLSCSSLQGSFGEYKGCSWGVAHDLYLQRYPSFEGKTARRWGKLALMIVTQGWSFQHLIDGVLPRLMQAWDGLKADTEISVLVDYNDKFPIVPKIWEHLLGRERLVVFDRSVLFE